MLDGDGGVDRRSTIVWSQGLRLASTIQPWRACRAWASTEVPSW
jgi:hypothetical protein